MGKMRRTYEEKIRRNLLEVSESSDYSAASLEWRLRSVFTEPHRCELCGHVILHNFELENSRNSNRLRVGCCCVVNYLVLAGHETMSSSNATAVRHMAAMEERFQAQVAHDPSFAHRAEKSEQWVREESAPFSRALLSDAYQRARNDEELGSIARIRETFAESGFVLWENWKMVVKLCRRTRIRRPLSA